MEKLVKWKNWLNEQKVKQKKMVKQKNWLNGKPQLNRKIS